MKQNGPEDPPVIIIERLKVLCFPSYFPGLKIETFIPLTPNYTNFVYLILPTLMSQAM